jgi:hypothetical protein
MAKHESLNSNKGSEGQKNTCTHTWIGCESMNDPMVGIYVQASDQVFPMIKMEETNYRIQNRIQGELHFLDGQTLCATLALNKHVWKT